MVALGLEKLGAGWVQESNECIVVVLLQKSNFDNTFFLDLKVFVKDLFAQPIAKDAQLLKNLGHAFRRHPNELDSILNLDSEMNGTERLRALEPLLSKHLSPLIQKMLSKKGIMEASNSTPSELLVYPAVKLKLVE